MNKQVKYTFGGTNQDFSKSKHTFKYYFEAQHIRLLATDTQSTGSVTNEKGNSKVITVPSLSINTALNNITVQQEGLDDIFITYNNVEIDEQVASGLLPISSSTQKIIGTTPTRSGIIMFTSDDLGMDCVWLIDNVLANDYTIELLYVRNLNFSINNPIQAIFNYENKKIEKVYWVDGSNQIRFLNLRHSIVNEDIEELIDIPSNTINFVGDFTLGEPYIQAIVFGGNHTAGKIQYAYNLYRINGAQTSLSPVSELLSLNKGGNLGGGVLNEIVGATPIVKVDNIDTEFTHIKLYSVKYTSFGEIPQVSLIEDREIGENNSLTYFDDGRIIEELTLEKFLFLGSDPIVPKHIESKDSRLFSANVKENNFDVDLDCRAYGFRESTSSSYILEDLELISGSLGIPDSTPMVGGNFLPVDNTYNIPKKHDSVNPNYDAYRYQYNSSIQGGTGKYIQYNIEPQSLDGEDRKGTFFKGEEIYRIGIQFYNKLGQVSFPKWIADFKSSKVIFPPFSSLLNTITVELTSEFYVWLNDSSNFETENDKPIGYNIIRADRTLLDKTVLYQGAISPMMFQVKGQEAEDYEQFNSTAGREAYQDVEIKIPSWAWRNFTSTMPLQPELANSPFASHPSKILAANHLAWLTQTEIHKVQDHNNKISQTFLHTAMMQFHSPDIVFNFGSVKAGLQLKVNGVALKAKEVIRSKEVFVATGGEKTGGKFEFYPDRHFVENNEMQGTFDTPSSQTSPRYIGPGSDAADTTDHYQMFRSYATFINNIKDPVNVYQIYGTPEITEKGAGTKTYFGNPKYKYQNSLTNFLSDGEDDCGGCDPISTINSDGIKSLTFVLGTGDNSTSDRKGLEDLFSDVQITPFSQSVILIADIFIQNEQVYLGNIYNGHTYEDKKRNSYIQIGSYTDINTNNVFIKHPGDTFISQYEFMRIGKTDVDLLSHTAPQFTEIISFPVETLVDLKNRSDNSLFDWDAEFQPSFDDYEQYNRVYSQNSTLISNTGEGSIFKSINEFDTRIYASKLKVAGENIDSWSDLLINETQDLDGKYGPINGLISYKDNLFTFQDEAIAKLSINPRVQVQGGDGIAVELGTGGIFYDYNYITTTSGSINKWGITPTNKGIYYYDAYNKAIGRIPDHTSIFLTDIKGLHTYFTNNYDYDLLKIDNPYLRSGVTFGYDNYNNDVYFTLLQGDKSFTRVYNELLEEFIDLKLYTPSSYIYKGEKLLLTDTTNNTMYEQFAGEYNTYFGIKQSSTVTLMLNPESDYDCIFDNIQYNSELYMNDIDQPDKTLTHLQAYNEYQDSGRIALVLGRNKNLRRKFRTWKADIPRDGRNRIRNPWIFLKLELDNQINSKLVLHDIIVSYTI
jgi:hypothetical protein|tara:strand:- start:2688 stop:6764 length:4077 start_codon:yes stop_codon:yes gene_type:complete